MSDLPNLISAAVAAKMTPEFIEQEIDTRVGKLIVESVDRAFRSYSDTGKLIEEAVAGALKVDKIDLPSYGSVVSTILKRQIETRVSELVAGRLSADMEDLLSLAPKRVKLSEIADFMRERHVDTHDEAYGPIITVILEETMYGSRWLNLDEDHHYEARDKNRCQHRLLVREDGTISGGYIEEKDTSKSTWVGRAYGVGQRLRAYIACGTVIELDEDAVCTSVGDY